ncbi:hypothetical protein ACI3L1_11050 [Deinococcus sp. SM5_A1]|uniref:hypothetical protein n=1 Tax=Deinococcus sp. SM5_A1 TaxID=3379094 RepID=UPI00385D94AA
MRANVLMGVCSAQEGAIQDQKQLLLILEKRQHEARDQELIHLELDKAFKPLVDGVFAAIQVDDRGQFPQDDGSSFNEGKDQGAEDGQPVGIKTEVRAQEQEVKQAVLGASALGVFHCRKHRTGADFFCLL